MCVCDCVSEQWIIHADFASGLVKKKRKKSATEMLIQKRVFCHVDQLIYMQMWGLKYCYRNYTCILYTA